MATFEGTATSNTSIIPASQTDYPEYVDLSNLPSSFWSTVSSDGSDIRCYSDSDLTNELPREVVSVDTGSNTGELHVKHDLSAGDTIYIDVDGSRSGYADSDTFGAENVWESDYLARYSLSDLSDSTSNNRNATVNGTVTPGDSTGQVGAGTSFPGGGTGADENLDTGFTVDGLVSSSITVSAWINGDDFSSDGRTIWGSYDGSNQIVFGSEGGDTDGIVFKTFPGDGTNSSDFSFSTGTWYYVVGIFDGSNYKLYVDGAEESSVASTSFVTPTNNQYIGEENRGSSTDPFNGIIDEVRILSTALSANWITTEYNNQNDPATFRTWSEFAQDQIGSVSEANASAVTLSDGSGVTKSD